MPSVALINSDRDKAYLLERGVKKHNPHAAVKVFLDRKDGFLAAETEDYDLVITDGRSTEFTWVSSLLYTPKSPLFRSS